MKTLFKYFKFGATLALGLGIAMSASLSTVAAAATDTVNIGTPPWPGVTIKSEVVAEILKPLGYAVKYTEASAPIVDLSMARGDVDISWRLVTGAGARVQKIREIGKDHQVRKQFNGRAGGICSSEL